MVYKWRYKTSDGFDDMLMNSDGKYLTGYGDKVALLAHEKNDMSKYFIPKKGNAL